MQPTTAALAVLSVLLATPSAAAQQGTADVQQLYKKKLESEFLTKAPWSTDYDAARQQAKAARHVLLAYFTRSYAG